MSNGCTTTMSRRSVRGRLLVSTATAAFGMAMLSSPARADTIPAECDVNGTEVTCVAGAPDTLGQIYTSVDNAYVKIGTAQIPAAVISDADGAVIMTGGDQLALQVAAGSSVTSTRGVGVLISSDPDTGIFVMGEGDYTGQTDGMRIYQAENGALQLYAHNITGVSGTGLAIDRATTNTAAIIGVSGTVAGAVDGVNIVDASSGGIIAGFNNVYGGNQGLAIDKNADGKIDLDISGDVLGAAGDAINVDHSGSGNIKVVTHGDLTGGDYAAWIELDGTGNIEFVNEGTITGEVNIRSRSMTGNVTAIVNEVVGDTQVAASAIEPGSDTSVTLIAAGHVEGNLYAHADNGDINISAQSVTTDASNVGAVYGISGGTGDVNLIVEGDVIARRAGVVAGNEVGGTIRIETQSVTSAEEVAVAANQFTETPGDVFILVHGDLKSGASGIFTHHAGDGNIEVTAEGSIDAGTRGVRVYHDGDGNVAIDTQGDITALYEGIAVLRGGDNNEPFGDGDVTVTTAGAIIADRGIVVSHRGSGNIAVDAGGSITGENSAISVVQNGEGAIAIHAANALTSVNGATINLYKIGDGDISVVADDVVSGEASVSISHFGTGTVSIAAAKDLNGSALVTAKGDVTLDVAGNVTGTDLVDYAVAVIAPDGLLDLDIAGDVSGSNIGVFAQAVDGMVDLTVGGKVTAVATGVDLTGANVTAMLNEVEADGTAVQLLASYDLNATIASAVGGEYGVLATSNGNLTLDIGDAIGTAQSGVELYAWDSMDVTVRGHVYGSDAGIRAYGNADQAWNFTIAEGAFVESEGFAFEMNALDGTGHLTLVNKGTIDGASGSGVFLSNSADGDRFENYGLVTGAVAPGLGDDEIVNAGTFEGTIWDIGGQDSFVNSGTFRGAISDVDGMVVNNAQGGLFEVIHSLGLDLGGGTMVNAGTFSSGGKGNVFVTKVNGSFVQDASGTMLVDVDLSGGTADLLKVVGDATLDGTVDVNFTGSLAANNEFLIVQTEGGDLTDAGLELGNASELSPLITLDLEFRDTKELYLTSTVDFTPDGADLNPNQEEIGEDLNDVFGADPDALDELTDALFDNADTLDGYGDLLAQLVPEIYLETLQTSLLAAQDFTAELGGCSAQNGVLLKDGKGCVKFTIGGDRFESDASFENVGFNDGTLKLQAGYFMPLAENLTLGFGLGYDDTLVKNDLFSKAQGHRFQTGLSLAWHQGGFSLGGTLSAGWTGYDADRNISIGDFASHTSGKQNVSAYSGDLAASYTAQIGGFYVKPATSLFATRLRSGKVAETGGQGTAVLIDRASKWYTGVRPSLELGSDFAVSEHVRVQPFVRAGATVLFDNDFALNGHFADAADLSDGFAFTSTLEDTRVDIDAGLRFRIGNGSVLSAQYTGQYTDRSESHGFRVSASFAF